MQFIRLFATFLAFGQSYRHVVRFNRWSFTTRILLAAASTLASPITTDSLSEETYMKRSVLVREPESPGSKLGTREPAEDICPPRGCQG